MHSEWLRNYDTALIVEHVSCKPVTKCSRRTRSRSVTAGKPQPGEHGSIAGLNIDKVIEIDQSAIGRTPRSNPATYTCVLFAIRDIYAMLPESRARGYKAERFSLNVKGGRCEALSSRYNVPWLPFPR